MEINNGMSLGHKRKRDDDIEISSELKEQEDINW